MSYERSRYDKNRRQKVARPVKIARAKRRRRLEELLLSELFEEKRHFPAYSTRA